MKNAVVQPITGDDGKDDADVFTIAVSNSGGKILERVFDAEEEIKPGTTFNIWLNKIKAAPADQVKGSKIVFRIDAKWDENWIISDAVHSCWNARAPAPSGRVYPQDDHWL